MLWNRSKSDFLCRHSKYFLWYNILNGGEREHSEHTFNKRTTIPGRSAVVIMSAIYELLIFLAILAVIVESKGEHTLRFFYQNIVFILSSLNLRSLICTFSLVQWFLAIWCMRAYVHTKRYGKIENICINYIMNWCAAIANIDMHLIWYFNVHKCIMFRNRY